jgi:hypothetical protein
MLHFYKITTKDGHLKAFTGKNVFSAEGYFYFNKHACVVCMMDVYIFMRKVLKINEGHKFIKY